MRRRPGHMRGCIGSRASTGHFRRTRRQSRRVLMTAPQAAPRRSGPEHGAARAGEEPGLDEQRQHLVLGHRFAVEALDRKALRTAGADVLDERGECRSQPLLIRLAERDERTAAALDEERSLAAQQDDVRAGDARRAGAAAPGPGKRSTVRLRWIGGGEDERLRLLALLRTQLAQTLDRAGERELRAAESLDEVAAPAGAERLQRALVGVDRAVAAGD